MTAILTYLLYQIRQVEYSECKTFYFTYYDIFSKIITITLNFIFSWFSVGILIINFYIQYLMQDKNGYIYKRFGKEECEEDKDLVKDDSKGYKNSHWLNTVVITVKKSS